VFQHVDANGVDLVDGTFNFSLTEATIGAGESTLAIARSYGRTGWADGLPGRFHRSLYPTNNRISVVFGSRVEHFDLDSNGNWIPQKRDGATMTGNANFYTYTSADGTVVHYGSAGRTGFATYSAGGGINYCTDDNDGECELVPVSVVRPNGRQLDLHWTVAAFCGEPDEEMRQPCRWYPRLVSLTNESSYLAKFRYALDTYTSAGPAPDWFRRTSARLVNTTVEACDPDALDCTGLTQSWPTVTYAQPSTGVTQVTAMGGLTWTFTETGGSFAIRTPGSSADNVTVTRNSTTRVVSQVTADGVTTNYSRSVSGSTGTMTVTNALSQATTIVSDLAIGRPTSITDPLSRTTSAQYDSAGRLTRTTAPEGNYTQLTYDSRGNVTQSQHVAKPGSGAATITTSASFPSTCANVVTCNLPTSTTDARGNVTDYTYDSTHGGTLSVTAPAVTVGGSAVRPQVRTTYSQSGGVYVPTQVSACETSASCIGTAGEVRTTIAYNSNRLPTSVSSGNGSGTLTATSAMTYDHVGNLVTVDGPLAGTADTVRHRYDSARRRIGTVSPDPDGAGSLPHRASRITYRADGQVSKTETGIVNSQSDSDWVSMIALEQVFTTFDSNNRPSVVSQGGGGSIHSAVQTSYDSLGRPQCVAQRMNPATWSALPSSACTQSTAGTHGPDRISRTTRNAAGETTQIETAVGTALQAAVSTTTYSANGRPLTLTDGENNRTSYEYDGHDRVRRTYLPLATQGSNASNSADYEELGYDAAGNVVTRRNRAGETAAYTFDALNRTVAKDLPGSEPDVTYGYDLLGRMLSASQTGHALSFTYDALGRRLTQTGPHGTVTSAWDLAGRRTRLTHPDGYYVDHDYLVTGEMTRIRENGATSGPNVLATFDYDTLGRRTSLTRGNGAVTTYAYDPASRLSQLTQDLAGTANDLTLGFTYNPASQIVENTRSNDLYSWTQNTAGTTSTTANGLNQIASWNGTLAYDARGNITAIGSSSYGYSSENLLTSAPGFTLTYDPLTRLYGLTGWVSTRRVYDGDELLLEYSETGALKRRFVHGPAVDEPLVWYGSGGGTRRYLHADEAPAPL
jgi:YD repeat-containing protein